jgi:hypothetical protein
MPDSAVLRAAILATEGSGADAALEWTDRGRLDGIIASWIGRELPPGTPSSVAADAAQCVTGELAPFVEAEALRIALAAIAAREPQPAPRVTEAQLSEALDGLSVDIHDGTCLGAGIIDRPHEVARALLSRLEPTYEPQPAPVESSSLGLKHAVTSNRLGHALAALREIAEPSGDEFPRDTARNALGDDAAIRDNVVLTREPQPAPELAEQLAATKLVLQETSRESSQRGTDLGTAWRLAEERREQLAGLRKQNEARGEVIREILSGPAVGHIHPNAIARWLVRAGLEGM